MADDHDVPVRSCCGQRHLGAVCPDGLVRCCLCFDRFPWDQLNQLPDGTREDVCVPCAVNDRLAPRSDHAIAMGLIERGALIKWTKVPQVYRLITQCPSMEQGTPLTCELARGHDGPHSFDTAGGGDG